jgi:FixJ family two-component response regulator
LIVEDDGDVLNALQFALEMEGYDVQAFSTASALAHAARDASAACLVVDQSLPDETGLELIVRLRRRDVLTPAVLITTDLPPVLQAQAAALAVPVVEKPLLSNALFATIRSLIDAA